MNTDESVESWLRVHLKNAPNVVAAQARTVADLTGITGMGEVEARDAVAKAYARIVPNGSGDRTTQTPGPPHNHEHLGAPVDSNPPYQQAAQQTGASANGYLAGPPQQHAQPGEFDWAQFYRDLPKLTEVNRMTVPQAFLWYIANGYNVRPERPIPGGRVLMVPWREWSYDRIPLMTMAEAQHLAANWRQEWSIGLVLSESSGLWGIDIDDPAAWERWQQEHGPVRAAAEQRTPRGLHLVYLRPEDGMLSWAPAPGIEIKAKGHLTVAPSIRGDGGRYAWLDGSTAPSEMPDGLAGVVAQTLARSAVDYETAVELRRREAKRRADAHEYAQAAGERRFLPFADLEQVPKPRALLDGMLTAGGFYGLAGPPEAGKSLMLRNWLCTLASGGIRCLYAASEGQFDLIDRFSAHSMYAAARANLWFYDGPLSLASAEDVAWLAGKLDGQYGLAVFDMIYGFGLPDDDGTKGVAPVINGCKRLAEKTGACVLVTGHPGHNGERRFRGSSMWRGSFDGEFHMAGGDFTCEKHKYSDKRRFRWPYAVEYPNLRVLSTYGQLDRAAHRMTAIAQDFGAYPGDSDNARAIRLASQLGLSKDRMRVHIRDYRASQAA